MKKMAVDTGRIKREEVFHDGWAESIQIDELLVSESFEMPTALENQHIIKHMGPLKGKRILDFGCGAGEAAVYFATQGAYVYACDISAGFLQVVNALATKFGVTVQTTKCDSAKTPYEDDYFDFIYGNGILHHVELEQTSIEVERILKPGGKAFFIEPLPYNPAINVYRKMAEAVRTVDEIPLSFKQMDAFGNKFAKYEHQEFWLFTLLIFFHFFFIRHWHPSKVRYWKRLIESGQDYAGLMNFWQKWDTRCMHIFPFLKYLCWNTVIRVEK